MSGPELLLHVCERILGSHVLSLHERVLLVANDGVPQQYGVVTLQTHKCSGDAGERGVAM